MGPPAARIAVASIEPGDYGLTYDLQMEYADGKDPQHPQFTSIGDRRVRRAAARPPRGTILLLHGYLQDRNYVTPWAVRLAQAGYRCVLVDLRGHGSFDRRTHLLRRLRIA